MITSIRNYLFPQAPVISSQETELTPVQPNFEFKKILSSRTIGPKFLNQNTFLSALIEHLNKNNQLLSTTECENIYSFARIDRKELAAALSENPLYMSRLEKLSNTTLGKLRECEDKHLIEVKSSLNRDQKQLQDALISTQKKVNHLYQQRKAIFTKVGIDENSLPGKYSKKYQELKKHRPQLHKINQELQTHFAKISSLQDQYQDKTLYATQAHNVAERIIKTNAQKLRATLNDHYAIFSHLDEPITPNLPKDPLSYTTENGVEYFNINNSRSKSDLLQDLLRGLKYDSPGLILITIDNMRQSPSIDKKYISLYEELNAKIDLSSIESEIRNDKERKLKPKTKTKFISEITALQSKMNEKTANFRHNIDNKQKTQLIFNT